MTSGHAARPATGDTELSSRLAAIVESSTDAIVTMTLTGVITSWNPGAAAMYGYAAQEIIGRNVRVLFPPGDTGEAAGILARIRRGEPITNLETTRVRKDGTRLDVSVSISPVRDATGRVTGVATVARDITARKRAEAQRQACEARRHRIERMETIGQLAGGVAHEFNNLLGAIIGYAGLVAGAVAADPSALADVREIQTAAHRAARLTKQLLTFGRGQPCHAQNLDLNSVLAGVRSLLEDSAGGRVQVHMQHAPDLPPVRADRAQLEQVVLNLASNARDAMPHGGTLTLTTGEVTLRTERDGMFSHVGPGRYVELTVSDTGRGMRTDVLRRAFEPFFTTKPAGQGTGLGLPTVYGIVSQAGGDISVESEEGMGTTVRICLPAATVAAGAGAPAGAPAGRQTILVVDDEPAVLAVTARMLRRGGYRTLEAASCDEALALLSAHHPQLLLTDSVMPGVAGLALADEARQLRPGLRVLNMTGSESRAAEAARAGGAAPSILKPFTAEGLLDKVRSVLGS